MKLYNAKDILNIAIAGHSGAGKTSIAEAMLYLSGATDRFGKVGEGNTVCDYDPEKSEERQPSARQLPRWSGEIIRSTYWTPPACSILKAQCVKPCAQQIRF